MVKVIDMVDGKVGKVVKVGDIKGMVFKGVEFESVGDDVYVDVGIKGMVLDDVVNVDEFEVEEKDLVLLLRDDLLGTGSKTRFIDYLIGHSDEFKDKKEIVFGSCPATGYAQISGPVVCKRYDKKLS